MVDIYTHNKVMSLFDKSYIDFEQLEAILDGRVTLEQFERERNWI